VFAAWGSWVARFRWPVLAVALAAVVGAGVWGMGVFGQLTEGGYNDPGSESTRAAEVIEAAVGAQSGDVVVIYTPSTGGIDDPVLQQRVENRLNALSTADVPAWTSYWKDHATQYASADRTKAVAVLELGGDDDGAKLASFRDIKDRLDVEGATTQVAGAAPLADASSARSTKDLGTAEAVSLPIVLILLLFIFGSLVAAALPVIIGGCAVLGSLGVLHLIGSHTDVNSFAVNVASLLGLGMAIDYGLFMVGRFREEQGFGRDPADAVRRTVATAGRTVLFSATLLMIALAGLLLFPQGFLKSLAYGGLAAVALAALLSLTLLPAILAVLGHRVDKIPVRLPKRRNAKPAGNGWASLADVVLRRPILVVIPLVAGLLVLAAPIRGVHFGENDERVLPASEPARQAFETLKADFPALSSVGIQVVLQGPAGKAPTAPVGRAFAAQVAKVPGITGAGPTGGGRDVLLLVATLQSQDPFSAQARDAVRGIRALPAPPGVQVLVGGTTAFNVDSLDATKNRLPLMVSLLVGATLLLMFLAFGSILLPIKAVLVSALSLSATFGALVWIFQDGHGSGLLQVTPAPLEVGIVVLMAAVVFGLSTDYEVFLLSRMVEARTRGASTAEAVTTGLARTGRVISAAAILLIVVTGAFALSAVTTMRFVGVGMIIALLLDATIVRMLLVPALLGLLGGAAWWAPGPLRRLQERAGLAEYAGEELFPTVSVGRHAAPDDAPSTSSSTTPPRHASGGAAPAISGVVVGDDEGSPWARQVTASASAPVAALPGPAPVAALPAGNEPVSPAGVAPVSPPGVAQVSPAGVALVSPDSVVQVSQAGVAQVFPPGVAQVSPAPAAPASEFFFAAEPTETAAGSTETAAGSTEFPPGRSDDDPAPSSPAAGGVPVSSGGALAAPDQTLQLPAPGSPAAPKAPTSPAPPVIGGPTTISGAPDRPTSGTGLAPRPPSGAGPAAQPTAPAGQVASDAPDTVAFAAVDAPDSADDQDGADHNTAARNAADPSRADSDNTVDDLHGPTVDLASRLEAEAKPYPEDDPNPETTAILELHPTNDRRSGRDQ
jgi:RND superfamily putative drug exporter